MTSTITTQSVVDKTKENLLTLDADPKMQKLLSIYQKLPEKEQDTLLLMIDAFSAGMEAQRAIDEPAMA